MLVAPLGQPQLFNRTVTEYTAGDVNVIGLPRCEARLSGTLQPRTFTSRHIPVVAEELSNTLECDPKSANALPSGQRRMEGLLAHLKQASSVLAERQKQAMSVDAETLVPEELDQLLHTEFERRCCFGDRSNTEFMSAHKWKKLLEECHIISGLHGMVQKGRASQQQQAGVVSLASADLVFHKVLHDMEFGSVRLTYDLFCKALLLVAQQAYPALDNQAAFAELLAQVAVVAAAKQEASQPADTPDLLLDPSVVVTLDNFKPALYDLFRTVCTAKLDNPGKARPGLGSIRTRERTYLKYAGSQGASSGEPVRSHAGRHSVSSMSSCRTSDSTCEPSSLRDCGMETLRTGSEQSDENEVVRTALRGMGLREDWETSLPDNQETVLTQEEQEQEELCQEPMPGEDGADGAAQHRRVPTGSYWRNRMDTSYDYLGQLEGSQSQVSYVNGAPMLRDRTRRLSIDQMMLMCTCLGIMPDFVTRLEVIAIFKRAQHTEFSQGLGSSLYGYLTYEEFVDAIGQLSIEAYSKQPFKEEYPEAHEKVEAFLLRMLPKDQRTLQELFHYGRGAPFGY